MVHIKHQTSPDDVLVCYSVYRNVQAVAYCPYHSASVAASSMRVPLETDMPSSLHCSVHNTPEALDVAELAINSASADRSYGERVVG